MMKTGRILLFLLAGFFGMTAAFMITGAFMPLRVQGDSMEPAIARGRQVLVNRTSYLIHEPEAGDIVAFPCDVYGEDGEGSLLIKRVVATAGDTVEIRGGALYVNGKMDGGYTGSPAYMDPMNKTTVGPDRVFVLSDNRGAALDSRDQAVGQLNIAELIGKVCWP